MSFSTESMPVHTYITDDHYCDENLHSVRQKSYGKTMMQRLHQYHTMPNLKMEKTLVDVTPRRIDTPDVPQELSHDQENTRGYIELPQTKINMPKKYDRNDYEPTRQDTHHGTPQALISSDSRRRHFAPIGINALGYRFFASSPTKFSNEKWNDVNELMKNSSTISPIGITHANSGNFNNKNKPKDDRTLSENDLDKIMTNNNVITHPPKNTMSNEELFSAIYKSKRKLNIKDNVGNAPPPADNTITTHSNKCLEQAGSRHSWSPESSYIISQDTSKTMINSISTARRDFKRLLLQQSTKMGPNRLSATEQLKLSRQQHCPQRNQTLINTTKQQQVSPLRTLSPRATWKFQTPRSDVLSSTIMEDTVAEEKAMKPFQPHSPYYTDIKSRTNCKRQLDLSENIPNKKILNKVDEIFHGYRECQNTNGNGSLRGEVLAEVQPTCINRDYGNYRARSVSPNQTININMNKVVSQSSSTPTLETAL